MLYRGAIENNAKRLEKEKKLFLALKWVEYLYRKISIIDRHPTNEDIEKVTDEILKWCTEYRTPFLVNNDVQDIEHVLDVKRFVKYMIQLYRYYRVFNALFNMTMDSVINVKMNRVIYSNNRKK